MACAADFLTDERKCRLQKFSVQLTAIIGIKTLHAVWGVFFILRYYDTYIQ